MKSYIEIKNKNTLLRDMLESDVDNYVRWFSKEVEWQEWDAPWDKEISSNTEELKIRFIKRFKNEKHTIRNRFEISTFDNKHIGWVSSYHINSDITKYAVGINIIENNQRGQGLGEEALSNFIIYILKNNRNINIYTETWSGNVRMVKLALKCGFEIAETNKDYRTINGKLYDGYTFILNKEKFYKKYQI